MIEALSRPEVFAAFLAAVATLFAAIATVLGPMVAARLAENLRRRGEKENEIRRMKMFVFITLMQGRGALFSEDCVKALNAIDVVFNSNRKVREAWADLYTGFDSANLLPPHVQNERLRILLKAMAADIGFSDDFRADDFARFYFPRALEEEVRLQELQRKDALQRLAAPEVAAANTQAPSTGPWPPKP